MGGGRRRALLALALILAAGCGSPERTPVYEDDELHQTPPPGWVERARAGAGVGGAAAKKSGPPLPALGASGKLPGEQLLVRYDRVQAGNLAWLRVSAGAAAAETRAADCLAGPAEWRRVGEPEAVDVGGQSGVRAVYLGRYEGQDFRNETVAVRRGPKVYLLTATFPAADAQAGDQVRQAVAGVTWR
jgi:hypothetical protein